MINVISHYNISIVIPTENRSHLLTALLESLKSDRDSYTDGSTEVIVVDSSEGGEKEKIMQACRNFDAMYYVGDASVRKKRNYGIMIAQYSYVLFLDSDVTVKKGLLSEYFKIYQQNENNSQLGGILGYTEFVGKKSFWWKVLELTTLVNSFSFAKKYPFHSWTIANNVSFKTDVLKEIGMFEEDFPFNLGGDDLDLSYRVNKAGYMIASAPEAIAYHSRSTWDSFQAIRDRAKRWGTMEKLIANRHPELYRAIIPKSYVLILIVLITSILFSVISGKWLATIITCCWIIVNSLAQYILNGINYGFKNPIYFFIASWIQGMYEYYRIRQSLKEKSMEAFYKGLIFNLSWVKSEMKNESLRLRTLFITYLLVFLLIVFIYR